MLTKALSTVERVQESAKFDEQKYKESETLGETFSSAGANYRNKLASPTGFEPAQSSALKNLQVLSMRQFKNLQRRKSA
jgi:hypothetical protein